MGVFGLRESENLFSSHSFTREEMDDDAGDFFVCVVVTSTASWCCVIIQG